MIKRCVMCDGPAWHKNSNGKREGYCSTACEKAGRYEIRRANARIKQLEERLIQYRLMVREFVAGDRKRKQALKATEAVEAELAEQKKGFIELLHKHNPELEGDQND